MTPIALDVGAHWGEVMLDYAHTHPDTDVYAFEPDLHAIWRIATVLPNYHALALAVSDHDGYAPLYVNRVPGCSSLHHLDAQALAAWPGGYNLLEVARLLVPTTRLDTFLGHIGADEVAWLKVDTQGHELAVLHGLGDWITRVQKITLEVCMTARAAYADSPTRGELTDVLFGHGFQLTHREAQTDGAEENWTFTRE